MLPLVGGFAISSDGYFVKSAMALNRIQKCTVWSEPLLFPCERGNILGRNSVNIATEFRMLITVLGSLVQ